MEIIFNWIVATSTYKETTSANTRQASMNVNENVAENIVDCLREHSNAKDMFITNNQLRDMWLPVRQAFKRPIDLVEVRHILQRDHNVIAQICESGDGWKLQIK